MGLVVLGKTEFAVRFAKRHRQHYLAVIWVHGTYEARLKDGFERIGKVVDKGASENYSDDVFDNQMCFVDNSDWLLITDNLDDDVTLDALRGRCLRGVWTAMML